MIEDSIDINIKDHLDIIRALSYNTIRQGLGQLLIQVADPATITLIQRAIISTFDMTSIVITVFELVVSVFQDHFTQLNNLIPCVIFKDEVVWYTRTESRVGLEELFHFFGIARKNNHDIITIVLHKFEDGINRFDSEVDASTFFIQTVSFVNKENPPTRFFKQVLRLLSCTTDTRRDQIRFGRFDKSELLTRKNPCFIQRFSQQTSYSGLSCTRISHKGSV